MKPKHRQELPLFFILVFVWLMLIATPSGVSYLINPDGHTHWMFLFMSLMMIGPMAVVFMVSFYLLVPLLFFKGHKVAYVGSTLLLIGLMNTRMFTADVSALDEFPRTGFYVWLAASIVIQLLAALCGLGLRAYLRSHQIQQQLEEERRKSTEAELIWLKNQLNPHFLFNSLNNISSLTQIDPDEAQEAIAQLSDLLRYTLYESNKPLVPLAGEVEFLHNYISMMKLRCTSMTMVKEELQSDGSSHMIAPLLFISFVENAFKHGTSNSQPSHIHISLHSDERSITFGCSNSNFPKSDHDRSGSGVGLENTRRRLDLLYPGRYEWKQSLADNVFSIEVVLHV